MFQAHQHMQPVLNSGALSGSSYSATEMPPAIKALHMGHAILWARKGSAQELHVHRCPHGWKTTSAPAAQQTTHSFPSSSASEPSTALLLLLMAPSVGLMQAWLVAWGPLQPGRSGRSA